MKVPTSSQADRAMRVSERMSERSSHDPIIIPKAQIRNPALRRHRIAQRDRVAGPCRAIVPGGSMQLLPEYIARYRRWLRCAQRLRFHSENAGKAAARKLCWPK